MNDSIRTVANNRPEVDDSDHFLPPAQRGVPREYEDVNPGRSAYLPPFRPGTGYIKYRKIKTQTPGPALASQVDAVR